MLLSEHSAIYPRLRGFRCTLISKTVSTNSISQQALHLFHIANIYFFKVNIQIFRGIFNKNYIFSECTPNFSMYNYKILNFRFKTHFYRFHLISKQKSLSKRNFIPETAFSNKNRYFAFTQRSDKEKKADPLKKQTLQKKKTKKFPHRLFFQPNKKKRASFGNFTERCPLFTRTPRS